MRFATFPVHVSKVLCLRNAALVTQNHLPKTEDLMLQNAAPLWKPPPGPPNISDAHVSCTAPATENASLQILFKCPMPANARETTSERPRVVRTCGAFNILTWKRASCHNGVHFFDISTSKSAPNLVCFAHFDLEMCFAPQQRTLFHHLNFQKWSDTVSFLHF